jgi:hypothetical protein
MILQFKNSPAIVRGVPKSLHVGMAICEMLHRSAGDVPRNAEDSSPAGRRRRCRGLSQDHSGHGRQETQ